MNAALGLLLAVVAPSPAAPPPPPAAPPEPAWELDASVAAYLLPDDDDYLQPTVTADRGPLHVEARYNYEARRTGSLFAGHGFGLGERLRLDVTPMLGVVVGRTTGLAPALELTLSFGPVELHSESEYLIDVGEVASNFFYSWSELSVRIWRWARAGAALQRTRVFETPEVAALGPLVGVSVWKIDATAYWFDPLTDVQFVVVALDVSF